MIVYADPFSRTGATFDSIERVAAVARLSGRELGAVIVVDTERVSARLIDVSNGEAA